MNSPISFQIGPYSDDFIIYHVLSRDSRGQVSTPIISENNC